MQLKENERIDYVNDSLSLIQRSDGLTFGTDALLLAGYVSNTHKTAVELGAGSGIISMLLVTRKKAQICEAVEIQEEYAELIERNLRLNRLEDRIHSVCADVRNYSYKEECDLVFTNPPYMKATSGAMCEVAAKTAARHEIYGGIDDFVKTAARLLKHGGIFAAVYRPDRLCDLFYSLRQQRLEPKRMTFVHADEKSEPSMVLIEAKAGAKSGLILTKPLIIYKDERHEEYGDDMNFIMENGSFPKSYRR